jgi:hypothetical protein
MMAGGPEKNKPKVGLSGVADARNLRASWTGETPVPLYVGGHGSVTYTH